MPPLNPIPATTTLSLPVRSLDELLGLGPGLAPAPDVQHGALPHVPLHPVAAQALLNRARGVGPHGMPPRGAVQQSPAADNPPSEPMAHLTVTHQQPSLAISEAQAVRAHAVQPKPAPAPKAVALQPGPLPPPPERAPAAPHPAAGTPALPAQPPMGLPMPAPGLGSAVAAGAGMAPVPAPGAGPSWMHRPLPFLDRVPVLGHITPGGFLHGLGEGLKYAGIAAGTEFAPGAMEMIPGTPQHAMVESIERQNAQREADVHQLAQTEEALRRAQAWKDLHPPERNPPTPFHAIGDTGWTVNEQTGQISPPPAGFHPATALHPVVGMVNGVPTTAIPGTDGWLQFGGPNNGAPLPGFVPGHPPAMKPLPPDIAAIVGPEPATNTYLGHTFATVADAQKAWGQAVEMAETKATFPRIEAVTDAQNNTLGWVYFIGGSGGGAPIVHFIGVSDIAGIPASLHGKIPAKLTGTNLTMKQLATTIQPQADRLAEEAVQVRRHLGAIQGRWSDLMTGKIGTDDPQFAGFLEDVHLYAAALTRTHFGGRSNEAFQKKLEDDFRAAQSLPDFLARVHAAEAWVQGYANLSSVEGSPAAAPRRGARRAVRPRPPANMPRGSVLMEKNGERRWVAPAYVHQNELLGAQVVH